MKKTVLSICMLAILLAVGCKKGNDYSNAPQIKILSIRPMAPVKNTDPVVIALECTDGDGDVGENTPDMKNLFVQDNRNGVVSAFRISQLAPSGSNVIIRTTLNVNLNPQGFVDDNNTSESATYSVWLFDRAGNKSNTVTTPSIEITAP